MPSVKEIASGIRSDLMQTVQWHGETPVCLSGGIDSASVLAAQIEAGYKPPCYTFRLGTTVSRDLKVAREMCATFGLTLHEAVIPQNEETLIADLEQLLPFCAEYLGQAYGVGRKLVKVPIQCVHAMSYVAEAIEKDGHRRAFTGFCADGYYGSGRALNQLLAREGWKAWQEYRIKYLVHPVNADLTVKAYFATKGVDLIDAFDTDGLRKLLLPLGAKTLNTPFPKAPSVYAFPDFWKRGAWVRKNESLQVTGGIREWHDTLLSSPINRNGRKVVVGLYADLLKQIDPTFAGGVEQEDEDD